MGVIGPSTTPRMLTPEQLTENPWWGLFCSMIHARKDYAEPLYKATMNQCIDSYEAGMLSHRDMDEISDTMQVLVHSDLEQSTTPPHNDLFASLLDDAVASPASLSFDLAVS
ncbi:hypothetical protein FRD01_11470 [Microvenator marinus]|uniref:Uncharacterized protein n=1 Tax=Microvenator marinus TaxID=2600177 RepID=A0A5B8XPM6_9DELT|nr:hypothetical protein [Microvenator marinus]QED27842.1 hypothetical protein FRD01_11470 [Microvenator marinus]